MHGFLNPIRTVIKTGDMEQIAQLEQGLKQMLHGLANVYTSANFRKLTPQDAIFLISECTNFVMNKFSMIGLDEIREAFQMASSGEIDANLKTYGGDFNIQMLGDVLSKYLKKRNRIVAMVQDQQKKEKNAITEAEKQKMNEDAKQHVIDEYKRLKDRYHHDFEIDESVIGPTWAQILLNAGLIDFEENEKRAIWQDAKLKTKQEYIKMLSKPEHKRNIISIRNIVNDFKRDIYGNDFKARQTVIYSKLLVIKSIIS